MPGNFAQPRNFRQRAWPRMREYNRLFQVANKIPDNVLYGPAGPGGQKAERWLDGISFDPISLEDLDCYSDEACGEEDDFDVVETDVSDAVTFLPVELRSSVQCSTIGLDGKELEDRMKANFAMWEAPRLTAMVTRGASCWPADNPNILEVGGATSTDIGFGVVLAIDEAVARLEDALRFLLPDVLGTIFMTPGMLTMLHGRGGLVFENDRWYTPAGTAIVADADGGGPDLPVDGGDPLVPGADFQWLYATGPVWAHRGPISMTTDPFSSFDGSNPRVLPRNIMRFFLRRHSIALFDPDVRFRVAAGYASSVFVG